MLDLARAAVPSGRFIHADIMEVQLESGSFDAAVLIFVLFHLPAEEHERWVETIWPVTEIWVEENEAKGYPARAILEDAIAFAEQYK